MCVCVCVIAIYEALSTPVPSVDTKEQHKIHKIEQI